MSDIDIYNRALKLFGAHMQMIVALEECSELQKELTKTIRGNGDLSNLAEEIADVEIMLDQMKLLFKLQSKVIEYKGAKIVRLKKVIESIEKTCPKNIDKIQKMGILDWHEQACKDEHLTPTLCFMCVGCEECLENCASGIEKWLNKESAGV